VKRRMNNDGRGSRVDHARFMHDYRRTWPSDDNMWQRRQRNADVHADSRVRCRCSTEFYRGEEQCFFHTQKQTHHSLATSLDAH
jgi:hypothetical protein